VKHAASRRVVAVILAAFLCQGCAGYLPVTAGTARPGAVRRQRVAPGVAAPSPGGLVRPPGIAGRSAVRPGATVEVARHGAPPVTLTVGSVGLEDFVGTGGERIAWATVVSVKPARRPSACVVFLAGVAVMVVQLLVYIHEERK